MSSVRWLGLAAICIFVSAEPDVGGSLRGTPHDVQQILVFDAGSSGTRIHVFNMQMHRGAAVPTIDLEVREKQMLKVKPGLSHFAKAEDLDGCQKNIQSLLEFANQFVPEERRSSTPCLLKATAGLRAVGEAKAELVLNRVRETFRASPYKFVENDWAAVIKGKEEAGLAWVAANYLRGTFDNSAAGASSLGVIEMGGGSTQVTFQVSNTDKVAEIDQFAFTTAQGQRYSLYAHSYLNFGQDYAQSKLREVMPASSLEDPCYPAGYDRKSASGGLIKGTGDATACKSNIRELILSQPTAPGKYASELPVRGPFVATENFFYVRKDVSVTPGVLALSNTDEQVGCSKAFTPPSEGNTDPGKPNYCFGLSYHKELLTSLKAFSQPGVEVEVKRQINGGDIDWALGAALLHYMEEIALTKGSGDFGSGLGWMPFLVALATGCLLLISAIRFLSAKRPDMGTVFSSAKDSDTDTPTKIGMARLPPKGMSGEVGTRTPHPTAPAE